MRTVSAETMKSQIHDVREEWGRDDLCAIDFGGGEVQVGWLKPVKVPLPFAGVALLDEVEIPFGAPDPFGAVPWNLNDVMSQRLRQHEKVRWFVDFEIRKEKKKKEYTDHVEAVRAEMKNDLESMNRIRVCL